MVSTGRKKIKEPIEIHLTDLEKGELSGERVVTEIVVRGVSKVYLVPKTYKATVGDYTETHTIKESDPLHVEMCGLSSFKQKKSLYGLAKYKLPPEVAASLAESESAELNVKVIERVSVTELIVSPVVKTLRQKKDGKIVDEKGRPYRKKTVYFVGYIDSNVREFQAEGYAIPNPKNSEATFLIYSLNQIAGGVDDFRITEEFKEAAKILQSEDINLEGIEKKIDFILKDMQNVHRLIGRDAGTLADLLVYHSPSRIQFEGDIVKGWVEIAKHGDTTTGKSEGTRRLHNYIGLGTVMVGETSSRTGFLYTIDTQTTGHTLVWGQYALNDRGLLAVDGAN